MTTPAVSYDATRPSASSSDSDLKRHSEDLEKPGASTFTQDSVFDDPLLAKHYTPPDSYEGKHRFDPNATWTEAEDRAIVRKCDLRITLFICVLFGALQLDRGNIVNALSDNMLVDIGITSNDYNLGQTIFYVSFLFMELPSQLISKRLGVDRWVPAQMIMWSIVAISQCRVHNKKTFFATRALLGALEGGFIPDAILYLSYFFRREELSIRLSFFWVALTTTNIIGNFLAAGLLKLRGTHGWAGWQFLFLIEGLITLSIGIFAAFYLPPSAVQTSGGLRGKDGWFTEREEVIIVNRILRDDPTKSDMHNRQHIGVRDLLRSFSDFDNYPLYLIGLTAYIAPATVTAYFSLILKGFGFSTFKINLLGIPWNVGFIINNIFLTHISKWTGERTLVASLGAWWQFIFLIVLVTIPDHTGPWIKYAILTLFLCYPYAHPILVSWNSANSGSVRQRSVSASLYNICVQLGTIIASNVYHVKDKPYYHKGNRVLLGIVSANIAIYLLTKVYFIYRNKYKQGKWNALTPEEKDHYLATTTDKGNRRLDFVFHH